jgi:hypothetical protein
MIGAGCLKKLLEVIGGLSRLALEVALSNGVELLVGVIGVLVIVDLTTALTPSCCLWHSYLRP